MAAQAAGPTRALAGFIVAASAADLPGWTLHEAKRTLINILGIAVSATRYEPAGILTAWVRRQGGNPAARVIGTDIRTGTFNAALANGYLAHLEDYDDTHLPTILHPSAPRLACSACRRRGDGRQRPRHAGGVCAGSGDGVPRGDVRLPVALRPGLARNRHCRSVRRRSGRGGASTASTPPG